MEAPRPGIESKPHCGLYCSCGNAGFFNPLLWHSTWAFVATWAAVVRFLSHAPQRELRNDSFNVKKHGVPAVAQGDQQCLGSAGWQVWSLAQHIGLRIWCYHSYGLDPTVAGIWSLARERHMPRGGQKEKKGKVKAKMAFPILVILLILNSAFSH